MSKRRFEIALAVLLVPIALGLGWYKFSPFHAISAIRNAVIAGDTATLNEHVDFVKLREGFKAQMTTHLMQTLGKPDRNPIAALGAMVAARLMDSMIETFATPSGLAAMLSNSLPKGAPISMWELAYSGNLDISRDGLDRFQLRAHSVSPEGIVMEFQRDWLDWKLANIQVPLAQLAGKGATTTSEIKTQAKPEWRFTERKDPMDDTITSVIRRDAEEDIPTRYSSVRPEVIIQCSQGKLSTYIDTKAFLDYDYSTYKTTVRLRLDGGKPLQQRWSTSTDHEAIFAPDALRFIRQLRSSSTVLIEYSSSKRLNVAKFKTDGLDAELSRTASSCNRPDLAKL